MSNATTAQIDGVAAQYHRQRSFISFLLGGKGEHEMNASTQFALDHRPDPISVLSLIKLENVIY